MGVDAGLGEARLRVSGSAGERNADAGWVGMVRWQRLGVVELTLWGRPVRHLGDTSAKVSMSSDLGLKWTVSECPATQETT